MIIMEIIRIKMIEKELNKSKNNKNIQKQVQRYIGSDSADDWLRRMTSGNI